MSTKPILVIGLDGNGAEAVRRIEGQKSGAVTFLEMYAVKPGILPSPLPSLHLYNMKAGWNEDVPITRRSISKKQTLEIRNAISDASFLVIVSPIYPNSGLGLTPLIAQLAKEMGIPVLIFVAHPYAFDDIQIRKKVDKAVRKLEKAGISAVLVNCRKSNDSTHRIGDWLDTLSDEIASAICGITELITQPGLINLDQPDIVHFLCGGKQIRFGYGTARGPSRDIQAAQGALLELGMTEKEIMSVKSVVVGLAANEFLTIREMSGAGNMIWEAMNQETELIFGSVWKENTGDDELTVKVYVAGG